MARPPAHATAPRPAQSPQVSREVCVCSGCSDSLASLMEGASRSRRPPSSRSTQACGSTPHWRSLVGFVGRAVYSIRRRFDERLLRRSFASSRQLQQPRAQLRLAVAQRVRLCQLRSLGGLKVVNIKPQKIPSPSPMATVRCRRSSMRTWRNCTSLHSTVLAQEQADYIGVKVEGPFKGGHYRYSDACFHSRVLSRAAFSMQYSDGENRRGSRSGRTLRGSSSSAGRPRRERSIAKNHLKSSSIEKNCFRSSSTWTSGIHRDKESLQNAKVQKPNWYTSARAHDATAEFPQILVHGLEL